MKDTLFQRTSDNNLSHIETVRSKLVEFSYNRTGIRVLNKTLSSVLNQFWWVLSIVPGSG